MSADPVFVARARLANLHRNGPPDPKAVAAARREYTVVKCTRDINAELDKYDWTDKERALLVSDILRQFQVELTAARFELTVNRMKRKTVEAFLASPDYSDEFKAEIAAALGGRSE